MYAKFTTTLCYICNELFLIGENGFKTRRIASFCTLFGRHQGLERKFYSLRDYSCIKEANSLARSVRKHPSFVVHMDAEPPV